MYNSLFCKLYNEFGWNEYPRVFAEQLWQWLGLNGIAVRDALDLGCGTGVLCEALHAHGVKTMGIDLSEAMIAIARERAPQLRYAVADMVSYQSERRWDLITCTGDAINHIPDLRDVGRVIKNAASALRPGGLFVFDLLNADEVPQGEPFEADCGDGLTVRFTSQMDGEGNTRLDIEALEGDTLKFSETIREKVHDVNTVLALLRDAGLEVLQCADRLLLEGDTHGATWFIVAQRKDGNGEDTPPTDTL